VDVTARRGSSVAAPLLTQNQHFAPSTQQPKEASLTRAMNPESVPANFPETNKGIKIVR
jgi:hypothetical protein